MNIRWLVLAYTALFVFGISDSIRGPIYPELLLHFKINHSEGSWFFGLVSIFSVISAMIAPRLIQALGHIRVLQINLVLMAVSQFLFASGQSFATVLWGAVLYGAGIGSLSVVQNVMVLKGSPHHLHQRFQSGLHACYGAASLLAPLLVVLFARWNYSWQASFYCSGFLIASLALASFLTGPSGKPVLKTQGLNPEMTPTAQTHKQKASRFWSGEEFYFAFILAFYVAVEVIVGTRLASYMREVLVMDLQSSSLMVTILFGGLLLGRLLFVIWHPRLSLRAQLQWSLLLVGSCLLISIAWWPWAILATGFFMGPFYPLMMTALARLFPTRLEQNISMGNAVQSSLLLGVHTCAGLVSDLWGLRAAMGFGILLTLVTILMLSLYSRFYKRAFG